MTQEELNTMVDAEAQRLGIGSQKLRIWRNRKLQSTEMKPQNETVGIGETSREGYMELNRIHIEEKVKMRRLYEKDLVSTLSELRHYLDIDMPESVQEQKKYGELEEFLNSGKYLFKIKDRILCITNEYGVAAEESGFRRGFQMAMRLCMEGMRGVSADRHPSGKSWQRAGQICKYTALCNGKEAEMDYSALTLEDCIRKRDQENQAVIIENGAVTGFTAD